MGLVPFGELNKQLQDNGPRFVLHLKEVAVVDVGGGAVLGNERVMNFERRDEDDRSADRCRL
jgi:hypothetical protein